MLTIILSNYQQFPVPLKWIFKQFLVSVVISPRQDSVENLPVPQPFLYFISFSLIQKHLSAYQLSFRVVLSYGRYTGKGNGWPCIWCERNRYWYLLVASRFSRLKICPLGDQSLAGLQRKSLGLGNNSLGLLQRLFGGVFLTWGRGLREILFSTLFVVCCSGVLLTGDSDWDEGSCFGCLYLGEMGKSFWVLAFCTRFRFDPGLGETTA